jgi:hypothetical protein
MKSPPHDSRRHRKSSIAHKAEAARLLGVDYKTYRVKLKKLEGGSADIR